uniref:Mercuric reductase n=1 Tax=Lotharella oceanica TaxID=641309 RepID=A0A7S2XGN5_9EUKA|mmetsp:Transcript_6707/g.13309  ORF Transcript_6707/g.13309 Transcript_6707/m.13309 type:complete len:591 (+) Transcript_6707:15-1787(+)
MTDAKEHGYPADSWQKYTAGGEAKAKEKEEKVKYALEELEVGPLDVHNAELLDAVHPVKWVQPVGIPVYNMVAIGAGAGGLVTCGQTHFAGGRAALIEKHLMGGDCLNIGCVPSKALLAAAKCAHKCRHAAEWGIEVKGVHVNFPKVMERMRKIRAHISENDSVQRFAHQKGVDVYQGTAQFNGPDTVKVTCTSGEERILKFRKACIATGGRARVPPAFKDTKYRTNATIFNLTELPARMAVVGVGPIGCELGQAFARFGTQVKLFSRSGVIMNKEDPEAAAIVKTQMEQDGCKFIAASIKSATQNGPKIRIVYVTKEDGKEVTEEFDQVLLSAGRVANVEGLNLEAAGVKLTDKKLIKVNDYLQTDNPNIYATGDCCLKEQFTHMAGTAAVLVADNANKSKTRKYSDFVIPRVTFTEPEVAAVGMSLAEIKTKYGQDYHEFKREFKIVDRNITDGYTLGFCKMHTKKSSDEILGCTIVGHGAGEMIAMVTTAMVGGVGALKVASIISPYPTMHENVKFTAAGFRGTLPNETPYWTKVMEDARKGKSKGLGSSTTYCVLGGALALLGAGIAYLKFSKCGSGSGSIADKSN